MIRFGPSGLGPVNGSLAFLDILQENKMQACEVSFTHSVYIKPEHCEHIKQRALEQGISLSVHASYFINLNSDDPDKVVASKRRIIDAAYIGEQLGATHVVFHPGMYGPRSRQETYERIRQEVQQLMHHFEQEGWSIKLAPETMGKINVFGSVHETANLVRDTKCSFCLDWAHMKARRDEHPIEEMVNLFPGPWHCHFSGINFGPGGEKNHLPTPHDEWVLLLRKLPKDKLITIINESPTMFQDTLDGIRLHEALADSET